MRLSCWILLCMILPAVLLSGCLRPVEQSSPYYEMAFFVEMQDGSLREISLDHPLPVGTELTARAYWSNTAGRNLPPAPDTTISLYCPVSGIIDIVEPLSGYPLGYTLRVAGTGSTELQFICHSDSQYANWYTSYVLTAE